MAPSIFKKREVIDAGDMSLAVPVIEPFFKPPERFPRRAELVQEIFSGYRLLQTS